MRTKQIDYIIDRLTSINTKKIGTTTLTSLQIDIEQYSTRQLLRLLEMVKNNKFIYTNRRIDRDYNYKEQLFEKSKPEPVYFMIDKDLLQLILPIITTELRDRKLKELLNTI